MSTKLLLSALLSAGVMLCCEPAIAADLHAGMACTNCHKSKTPSASDITDVTCLSCHESREKLAAKTAKWGNRNPHDNHRGEVPCTECHHNHKPSELMCNQCHSFNDMNGIFSKSKK